MWNLLSIVREMFKRNDRNAIPLLEIITEECLATEKVTRPLDFYLKANCKVYTEMLFLCINFDYSS